MNALEIPELRGRNPESSRRSIYSPHSQLQALVPKWKRILTAVLDRFPEVESCVLARIKPGPLERDAFAGFHLFAVSVDEFVPVSRMRELELILTRLFQADGQTIRFAAARGGERDALFPQTPLFKQARARGTLLYRRAPAPVPSRTELDAFAALLRLQRTAA